MGSVGDVDFVRCRHHRLEGLARDEETRHRRHLEEMEDGLESDVRRRWIRRHRLEVLDDLVLDDFRRSIRRRHLEGLDDLESGDFHRSIRRHRLDDLELGDFRRSSRHSIRRRSGCPHWSRRSSHRPNVRRRSGELDGFHPEGPACSCQNRPRSRYLRKCLRCSRSGSRRLPCCSKSYRKTRYGKKCASPDRPG